MLSKLLKMWCRHAHTTTPRKDEAGEYVRCLECAERIPYSTEGTWRRVA